MLREYKLSKIYEHHKIYEQLRVLNTHIKSTTKDQTLYGCYKYIFYLQSTTFVSILYTQV